MQEMEYWVPGHVREYLRGLGYSTSAMENMETHIRSWNEWMGAVGDFYSYHDVDGFGRSYEVHRRSLKPAMRVCTEWGSLLLNDKTQVVCESQECNDWLAGWMAETGFLAQARACLVRSFGLGTGAWALWVDTFEKKIRLKCHDARMVVPLT